MNTEKKFTKGDWQRNIKPATKYPTVFAGRNTHVCYLNTQGKSEEELEANISLITAAPELLEALQELLRTLDAYYLQALKSEDVGAACVDLVLAKEKALLAISKSLSQTTQSANAGKE